MANEQTRSKGPSSNISITLGNLVRDPESKMVQAKGESVMVTEFSMAINRKFGDKVDFFDYRAWRGLAETISNYKKKGDQMLVEGELQQDRWTNDAGENRSRVYVLANNVQFTGSPRSTRDADPDTSPPDYDDEDIPF